MTRRRWLRASVWGLAVALFAWTLSRVSIAEAFAALRELEALEIVVLVAINGLAVFAYAARWWIILRGLGYAPGFVPLSMYRLAAFGFAYFTPGPQVGGEPTQVLLLERRHQTPREVAIASVALDRLFDGLVNLGLLASAALFLATGGAWVLALLVLLPLVYLLALASGRTPLAALIGWDVVRDSERTAGRFCRQRPRHLALVLLVSFAGWGVMLVEYWLVLAFLGLSLSAEQVLVGLVAARVAYLLFFPAGLGVLEAGQVMAVQSMGMPAATGITVSLVIRLRDVAVAAIGLWWGMRALMRPAPEEIRETLRS